MLFSPQISYITLRRTAENAVKLCEFSARLSSELRERYHISAFTTCFSPCTDSNLSCQPLPLPQLQIALKSSIFVLNLIQIHSTFCKIYALNFFKISGEITIFGGETLIFVSSPVTLVVKLIIFTA